MEEIILKHLNREKLSPTEEAKLERWLTLDQKNSKIFHQLKLNLRGASPEQMKDMKGEVWDQLSTKIHLDDSPSSTYLSLSNWLKIAAVLLLAVGLGSLVYFESLTLNSESHVTRVMVEKESLSGQKLTFLLPDGSTVKLNAGSKLTFPREFDLGTREINLEGEAFFDIERDEQRPFVIKTENLNVEVLGTSFNVKVYPDEDEMSVAVQTGKVSVEMLDGEGQYLLESNEMVSYSVSAGSTEKQVLEDSQLVFGWTDKKLTYENANITRILKDLSRWYGVDFEIAKSLDYNKKISGRYDNPSLVDVMNSLSFAYEFEFEIINKQIIIK